jgi:hypothetical protein
MLVEWWYVVKWLTISSVGCLIDNAIMLSLARPKAKHLLTQEIVLSVVSNKSLNEKLFDQYLVSSFAWGLRED